MIPIMSNLQSSCRTFSSSSLFLRLQMFKWAILKDVCEYSRLVRRSVMWHSEGSTSIEPYSAKSKTDKFSKITHWLKLKNKQ